MDIRKRLQGKLVLCAMEGVSCGEFCATAGKGAGMVTLGGLNIDALTQGSGEQFSPKTGENVRDWLAREIPLAKKSGAMVAVGLRSSTVEALISTGKILEELGADVLEIDAHCNNRYLHEMGTGHYLVRNPDKLAAWVQELSRKVSIPISVKCATHVMKHYGAFAKRMEFSGASIINLDIRTIKFPLYYMHQPKIEIISQVRKYSSIFLIATGTVQDAAKAKLFLREGADAVGIASAARKDHAFISRIAAELDHGIHA